MEGRKRRRLRIVPFLVFSLVLVLALGAGYVLANQFIFHKANPLTALTDDSPELNGRMNFLLMGIDARQGETKTRTDSMILVSVDKEHNRMAMLSIPRDTRVEIPGHGYEKINAANVYGGPELAMETVSKLLGVPVDNYVMTNVRGFRDIVDTLGGVTINVEKRMYHYDPYDEPDMRRIDLQPGVQKMDGNKALQYVRFRSDALGDVSRTERQQNFLKALAKEMLQPASITKLPKLVPTINEYVDTNLGLGDMVTLANAAKDLGNVEIVTQTLPGKFLNMNGVSYWSVDPDQANMVATSIIEEGKAYDVVMGEENVNNKDIASESTRKTTDSVKTTTTETKKKTTTTERSVAEENQSGKAPVNTGTNNSDSGVQVIVNPPGQSGSTQTAPSHTNTGTNNSNSGSTQEPTGSESGSWLPAKPI